MKEISERNKDLKVGDILYKITDFGVIPVVIEDMDMFRYLKVGGTKIFDISKSKLYFRTEKEALESIEQINIIKEKKKRLYEYEKQLNEELGIKTFIVKY